MGKVTRWGILGASNFAQNHMAPAIHQAEDAELAAIATSDPAKAAGFRAFNPALRVLTGYDALLADPAIDAVYIPLPNHLHVEWTAKALARRQACALRETHRDVGWPDTIRSSACASRPASLPQKPT